MKRKGLRTKVRVGLRCELGSRKERVKDGNKRVFERELVGRREDERIDLTRARLKSEQNAGRQKLKMRIKRREMERRWQEMKAARGIGGEHSAAASQKNCFNKNFFKLFSSQSYLGYPN